MIEGARFAVQLALLIALAFLTAKIGWLLVAPNDAVAAKTARALPSPVGGARGQQVRADLSLLMKENPFTASDSAGAAIAIEDAPETDLNLKLVALFMSTGDAAVSSATIITPDNKATRFEPGEEILPGVRLQRVLSDRAIISRDGREETIMRSGRDAGLSVIGDTDSTRIEADRVATQSAPLFEPGVTAQTLLAGLDAEPQMQDGRVTAIVLRPRGDGSLMRSAGLEPGDRLMQVNGAAVSEADVATLSRQLAAGGSATLDIVRSGEARTIEIRFEEE